MCLAKSRLSFSLYYPQSVSSRDANLQASSVLKHTKNELDYKEAFCHLYCTIDNVTEISLKFTNILLKISLKFSQIFHSYSVKFTKNLSLKFQWISSMHLIFLFCKKKNANHMCTNHVIMWESHPEHDEKHRYDEYLLIIEENYAYFSIKSELWVLIRIATWKWF